jgi:hypothetical protein
MQKSESKNTLKNQNKRFYKRENIFSGKKQYVRSKLYIIFILYLPRPKRLMAARRVRESLGVGEDCVRVIGLKIAEE